MTLEMQLKVIMNSLCTSKDSYAIPFTESFINQMTDVSRLRVFKLMHSSDPFTPSNNLQECCEKIYQTHSLLQTLEFCAFRNPMIRPYIRSVFPEMMVGSE